MHENSRTLCRSFAVGLKTFTTGPLAIADVGSFDVNGTYRDLFDPPSWTYTGFDMQAGKNVEVVHEFGTGLPVEFRERFDVVISGQCMEHVAAPWRWIIDVAALLKPGGLLWLCVPNAEQYHPYPVDCWRVWPDGMRAIFREAGLIEISCYAQGPDTVGIARKPGFTFTWPEDVEKAVVECVPGAGGGHGGYPPAGFTGAGGWPGGEARGKGES